MRLATMSSAAPSDVVELSGLSLDCVVGVLPRERAAAQRLYATVSLSLDLRAAGSSDAL
jgi:dihydroneopterin aldolase